MSAEIIDLAGRRPVGNGAREALIEMAREFYPDFTADDVEAYADHILAELWVRGFVVAVIGESAA